MCISPPLPGFCDNNFVNIVFGKIYLPITALLDGASFIDGFSITLSIKKLFLTHQHFEIQDKMLP